MAENPTPEFINTIDESVPKDEYHLRIVMRSNETGEDVEHKFVLHEGTAIYELRDLVEQGFFNDPNGVPDSALVLQLIQSLLAAGESSATEKGKQLRALIDEDPEYVITGDE